MLGTNTQLLLKSMNINEPNSLIKKKKKTQTGRAYQKRGTLLWLPLRNTPTTKDRHLQSIENIETC